MDSFSPHNSAILVFEGPQAPDYLDNKLVRIQVPLQWDYGHF